MFCNLILSSLSYLTQKGVFTQSPLTLRVLLAREQTSRVQEDVACFTLRSRFSFLAGNANTLAMRKKKNRSLTRILTQKLYVFAGLASASNFVPLGHRGTFVTEWR